MNLTDFISHFPDEQTCKNKWKGIRIRQGVVCPECGCTEYWWKSDKECFECRCCHHRQSLRAGTIMHGSQLPFRYWFIAMYLLTGTDENISASELQRLLGHRNYRPVSAMLQKIRTAIGRGEVQDILAGAIEDDEVFRFAELGDPQKN